MSPKRRIPVRALLASFAVLLLPTSVRAVPVPIALGDFGPGAATIDFDGFPTGSLPSVPGMTLTPTGFADLMSGSGWGGGSNPGRNSLVYTSGFRIDLASPVTRIGFVFGGNTSNTVDVSLESGASTTGTFPVTSAAGPPDGVGNWIFYGFEDPAGIDALVFGPELSSGWAVGFYDLTTEGVPEPSSFGLVALGLAGLAVRCRPGAAP